MKRKSVLLLCALTTVGAFAQKSVVDDVDHKIGGFGANVETFKSAAKDIAPALDNAETKDDAKTWFVAGKANIGVYDQYLVYLQMGKESEIDKPLMGKSLVKAYDCFVTALPLDSVKETNKDGTYKLDKKTGRPKVKTKYSKDIIDILVGHHNDFSIAGSFLYDAKQYKDAAAAWGVYVNMPYSGIAAREKFVAADSVIAQMAFYQGVALWQGEDLKGAVDAFANARRMGYVKKDAFDYAMNCCAQLQDNAGIVALAREALPLFGKEDTQYINIVINDCINNGKFDEANQLVSEALAAEPNSAQLYNVKGVMLENQGNEDEALECFKKSAILDANYVQGQFNAGRLLMKKAMKLQDENDKLTGAAFSRFKAENVIPLYKEALPFMKAAYDLDSTDMQTKRLLGNIYYMLNMDAELEALGL